MTFEKLRKNDDVKSEGDVIYSSTFTTDVYAFTVDMAYVDESDKGAALMSLSLIAEDGRTLKQIIYFTSGDEKNNEITYAVRGMDGKPTGEKKYLPGFTIASDIHELLTDGVELADMETEAKLVKVWDKESSTEKPTEKAVLVDLIGKTIKLGIQQQLVFKSVNKDGKYVETEDVINRNEINKVFDAESDQTVSEIKAEEDSVYLAKWITSYKDVVFDKTKKKKTDGDSKSSSSSKDATAKKKKMFD